MCVSLDAKQDIRAIGLSARSATDQFVAALVQIAVAAQRRMNND